MFRIIVSLLILAWSLGPLPASDCLPAAADLDLPVKLKTRGKPKIAHWEQVDRIMTTIAESLEDQSCRLTLAQLFRTDQTELLFPLTNTVLRTIPEETLSNLEVFDKEGNRIGSFAGKVRFDRSGGLYARQSYSLYYFQFKTDSGRLESSGRQLLMDRFAVKWSDISEKTAITSSPESSMFSRPGGI